MILLHSRHNTSDTSQRRWSDFTNLSGAEALPMQNRHVTHPPFSEVDSLSIRPVSLKRYTG